MRHRDETHYGNAEEWLPKHQDQWARKRHDLERGFIVRNREDPENNPLPLSDPEDMGAYYTFPEQEEGSMYEEPTFALCSNVESVHAEGVRASLVDTPISSMAHKRRISNIAF